MKPENSEKCGCERILTFFLSCWLACAVCCGLGIAVIAGIAYGYNYCLAEFITLTRSDVSVYMRRGVFYNKPDFYTKNSSRSGHEDNEVPPGDDSIAGQWQQREDTRKYAEKLTKYSDTRKNIIAVEQSDKYQQEGQSEDNPVLGLRDKTQVDSRLNQFLQSQRVPEEKNDYILPTQPTPRISMLPNQYISTTLLQSGSSEILMRMFEPISNTLPDLSDDVDEYDEKPIIVLNNESDMNTTPEILERKTVAVAPGTKIQVEDVPTRKFITIKHWGSTKPFIMGYSSDVDEDNVAYKAV